MNGKGKLKFAPENLKCEPDVSKVLPLHQWFRCLSVVINVNLSILFREYKDGTFMFLSYKLCSVRESEAKLCNSWLK